MIPSSRTPEGMPDLCPICGKNVCLETSSFPILDAPCPYCGHLFWFTETDKDEFPLGEYLGQFAFDKLPSSQAVDNPGLGFGWVILSAITAVIVWAADGTVWTALAWIAFSLIFGKRILPAIFRFGQSPWLNKGFWRGVAFSWALASGIPVGMFFGVLLAWVFDWPGSAAFGGLAGLIVGPLLAAIEGMVVVGLIVGGIWMVTGRNVPQN